MLEFQVFTVQQISMANFMCILFIDSFSKCRRVQSLDYQRDKEEEGIDMLVLLQENEVQCSLPH